MHDDGPPTRRMWVTCLAIAIVLAMLVGLWFVWSVQHALSMPPAPTTSTTTTTTLPLELPAVATAPAVRVSIPTLEAPAFDCARYVNALQYEWQNLTPVHDAYRVTAKCLGWPTETIDRWEHFIVEDVIRNESGGCWNLRRGGRVVTWLGCVLGYFNDAGQWVSTQGTREDSGFGQLIGIWWRGPGTPVCDRLILCSSNDVTASPWNSMRALLVAIEEDGKGPWCYDARARHLHPACSSVTRYWP